MDSLAFHQALENNAIHFGVEAGEDMLVVGVQTLSQFKRRAFELMTLALLHPRFDAAALERMRAADASELKELEEDPDYMASLTWKRLAFPGHPYGRPRRGTFDSLARITTEDLHIYARQHFVFNSCNPALIAVVGDITAKEVTQWLSRLPSAGACDKRMPVIADVTVKDGGASPVVVAMPVAQTVVTASLPAVKRDSPRYYAVEVLSYILGGNSLTARLGREIRDRRGLAYYAESGVETHDHTGYIAMNFATRNAEATAAIDVFKNTLTTIREQGVTSQELADAKSYMTGSFPLGLDNEPALAGYLIAMQHHHLGIDYMDTRNAAIEAVTLDEVNAASREFMAHTPLIVMAGQPAKEKP